MPATAISVAPRRITASLGAALAGLIVNAALTTAADLALIAAGVFPRFNEAAIYTAPMLGFALIYRSMFAIFGCYVTARGAPDQPMKHALALGLAGFAGAVAGAIEMWGVAAHWYSLAAVAMTLPCAWVGGRLCEKRLASEGGSGPESYREHQLGQEFDRAECC